MKNGYNKFARLIDMIRQSRMRKRKSAKYRGWVAKHNRDTSNGWPGAENERRARLLHELYLSYSAEAAEQGGMTTYENSLPPDQWVNTQLARNGETWRVQNVDGFRYEIYEVASHAL